MLTYCHVKDYLPGFTFSFSSVSASPVFDSYSRIISVTLHLQKKDYVHTTHELHCTSNIMQYPSWHPLPPQWPDRGGQKAGVFGWSCSYRVNVQTRVIHPNHSLRETHLCLDPHPTPAHSPSGWLTQTSTKRYNPSEQYFLSTYFTGRPNWVLNYFRYAILPNSKNFIYVN